MRVVGLTGNFGSGKSTVAGMFRQAGIPVIDADQVSREVTAPGGAAYEQVLQEFGENVLLPGGGIDRTRLGALVFADPERRRRLEAITHPAILASLKDALSRLAEAGHSVALVEAALIHESGRKGMISEVITVQCEGETQLRRVTARDGISRDQAAARIGAQMDPADKAGRSDYVIDNTGSLDRTRVQVERVARLLLAG
jgi:dephospho-CoA kinase